MGVKRSILAAHLVFAAAGVVAAYGVASKTAEAVHPARPKWVILNTACWMSFSWAYNDPHAPNSIVSDFAAEQSSLMNFVWCNEYSGAHDPIFLNMGGWA